MKYSISILLVSFFLLTHFSCTAGNADTNVKAEINVSTSSLQFEAAASSQEVTINSTLNWLVTVLPATTEWCSVNTKTGNSGSTKVTVSLVENELFTNRTCTLSVQSEDVTKQIIIEQKGRTVESSEYKTAREVAKDIVMGWNVGNQLDAEGGETAWGNPRITEELILLAKANGFNAIRIPVRWYQNASDDEAFVISDAWMKRVQEVVDYCINNGLYAIINTHHEKWLESNPVYSGADERNRKLANLWTQVANYFKDYNEYLLFAGTNEVHIDNIWDDSQVTAENKACHRRYLETFVSTVRATGGNNEKRNLIIQSYCTTPNLAISDLASYIDQIEGPEHLMAEVHSYDPYDFALSETNKYWGEPYKSYGIGTWGQEDFINDLYSRLRKAFVDKGYVVMLGECGANRHSNTNATMMASRAYYLTQVISAAKSNGVIPFYWDNGSLGNGTETFGLFDRNNKTVFDPTAIEGIRKGAATSYPY
ncbi:MAG: cellulase family glycosylhydrolase [Phocaeicola sp.]